MSVKLSDVRIDDVLLRSRLLFQGWKTTTACRYYKSRLVDGRTCESTLFPVRPERFDLIVRSGVDASLVG
ncbi:hypothetical protein [Burkholderia sp. IMCC1007]|uniref:hypothetical protein n=1 Tax=Burkholderia sp. IMCC1007 TaxID=3004104 RepID=UPI0022B41AE7|nr:hypothetical protein [Burkholderia sp. IMCC1007]